MARKEKCGVQKSRESSLASHAAEKLDEDKRESIAVLLRVGSPDQQQHLQELRNANSWVPPQLY